MDKLGVNQDKITVIKIPTLFSIKKVNNEDYNLKLVLNRLSIKKPYCLWASSSMAPHKNHLNLLRAIDIVQNRNKSSLQLVCTGTKSGGVSENENPIFQYIKRKRLDVILTDVLSDHDLVMVNNACDFVICPTIFEGGGSGPALEAAALGKPVLCSDIPQLREMYDHREDLCIFFDPFDPNDIAEKIEYVVSNPKKAGEMAMRAKEWINSNRSWDTAAKQYIQVIQKVNAEV